MILKYDTEVARKYGTAAAVLYAYINLKAEECGVGGFFAKILALSDELGLSPYEIKTASRALLEQGLIATNRESPKGHIFFSIGYGALSEKTI